MKFNDAFENEMKKNEDWSFNSAGANLLKKHGKPISKEDWENLVPEKPVSGDASDSKKRFNVQDNIGKAKHVVNFYSGKKHSDGSDFYDIKIFNNKKDLGDFVKKLSEEGYKEENSFSESKKNIKTMSIAELAQVLIDQKHGLPLAAVYEAGRFWTEARRESWLVKETVSLLEAMEPEALEATKAEAEGADRAVFKLVVDSDDKRGTYAAHVEDSEGKEVMAIKVMPETEGEDFEKLWMKHGKDMDGLKKYLTHLKIMKAGDVLECDEDKEKDGDFEDKNDWGESEGPKDESRKVNGKQMNESHETIMKDLKTWVDAKLSPEIKKKIQAVEANVMHGPGHGSFSDETLEAVKDAVHALPADLWYDYQSGEFMEKEPEGEDMHDEIYHVDFDDIKKAAVGKAVAEHI